MQKIMASYEAVNFIYNGWAHPKILLNQFDLGV